MRLTFFLRVFQNYLQKIRHAIQNEYRRNTIRPNNPVTLLKSLQNIKSIQRLFVSLATWLRRRTYYHPPPTTQKSQLK